MRCPAGTGKELGRKHDNSCTHPLRMRGADSLIATFIPFASTSATAQAPNVEEPTREPPPSDAARNPICPIIHSLNHQAGRGKRHGLRTHGRRRLRVALWIPICMATYPLKQAGGANKGILEGPKRAADAKTATTPSAQPSLTTSAPTAPKSSIDKTPRAGYDTDYRR